MDNETLLTELEHAIKGISQHTSGIEVIGGEAGTPSAMILLNEDNVNGDSCFVIIGGRADNTAFVSFYTDYYDPNNCTEFFECKDINHAIKLLASSFASN
jgi:hypothetical protein